MNEIVNKFLLVGDKFMPEMRLKQPGFTYNACGPFTKNKKNWKVYANWKYRFYVYIKMNMIKLLFNIANQKI